LQAAARESHIARPGITLPTGSLDKEQLLAGIFRSPKDQRDGRSGKSTPERNFLGAQMAYPGLRSHVKLSFDVR
jgi:hypothetical protein